MRLDSFWFRSTGLVLGVLALVALGPADIALAGSEPAPAGAPVERVLDLLGGPYVTSPAPQAAADQQYGSCYYRVVAGDTLYRIALRYGTTWAALAYANGLVNPNWIYAGQLLRVPSCSGPAPGGQGYIVSTTLATSVAPGTLDPVNPTTHFSPTDATFHLVVAIQNAPYNTYYQANWYFGASYINRSAAWAGGTRNIDLKVTQTQPWSTGLYHVDVSVNGRLLRAVYFFVN